MSSDPHDQSLRVLIANEKQERLGTITDVLAGLLHDGDPEFVNEAAKRGVFADVTDNDAGELRSTLDIVLRRFAEYHNLEGAFARRAMIEQAKGILMATHAIDDQEAFDMLRSQSQQTGTRLIDLAEAVV